MYLKAFHCQLWIQLLALFYPSDVFECYIKPSTNF